MSVSVIVLSYRPGDWLAPCLASVTGQADEVLLIDNGSPDGLASRIGRDAGVRVVRSPANRGFAPGVNEGVLCARGDVLALLNDDAVAGPGWLAGATRVLEDPTVAAVGPKVVLAGRYREVVCAGPEWRAPGDDRPLGRQVRSVTLNGTEMLARASGPGLHRLERDGQGDQWRWTAGPRPWYLPLPNDAGPEGTGPEGTGPMEVLVDGEPAPGGPTVRLVNSAGAFLDKRGYSGDIGADTADDGRLDQVAERFAVSGAAFVTRRETWLRLGPFAGRYFAYYEDVDWCWRAQLAGLRVVYDPSTTVEHRRSASSGGEHDPGVRVMSERNRTLTMVRNGPRSLAVKALADRVRNGPDGGVRAGIARLLPWAAASRARLAGQWVVRPEEVWARWAGRDVSWPDGPAGPSARI